jgi:hypothetical protein
MTKDEAIKILIATSLDYIIATDSDEITVTRVLSAIDAMNRPTTAAIGGEKAFREHRERHFDE